MNIVIPFRNTCGQEELKMCIKLIRKNLKMKYNHIYVIGDECDIIDVVNINVKEQKYNKWLDSNFLVEKYINEIKEPFILFNDDFFLTKEVFNIPYYFYDTLKNRTLTTYIINERTNKIQLSSYGLNIQAFLNQYGDYENYEVHIPIVIKYPNIMRKAIIFCNLDDCPALKRSLYVKLCEKEGLIKLDKYKLEHDVKFNEPLRVIQYPFFSLTDNIEFKAFKEKLEEIADAREE